MALKPRNIELACAIRRFALPASQPRYRLYLLLASALLLAGCDSLLDVEAPTRLPAPDIQTPENALVLVDGAQADFECALANYIVAGGEIGDELEQHAGSAGRWGYDRRSYTAADPWYANFPCEGGPGAAGALSVYAPLQTARFAASETERLLEGWTDEQVPNRLNLIARVAAFSGYSTLLFGEGFCTAAIDLGPELSRSEVFQLAEEIFTRAMGTAASTGDSNLLNLAQVGRARARVNLGDFVGALVDAREVPRDFRFEGRYSGVTSRTENRVYTANIRSRSSGIGPLYRDLEYEGVPDPRVPVRNDGLIGPARDDSLWVQDIYTSISSPIPIATWEEAQVIIAEAELETGNPQGAVDAINVLHANVGLPAFASTDEQEIREHVIEERRRQLFLQGHHLGDLIRFDLPLVPPPGTPYPRVGGFYGTMTCLPLPDVERLNNPNIP